MNKKIVATKAAGIGLFFIGLFLTIGAMFVLPFFFALLFAGVIVIGLLMIRKAGKMQEKEKEKMLHETRHERGWGEEEEK